MDVGNEREEIKGVLMSFIKKKGGKAIVKEKIVSSVSVMSRLACIFDLGMFMWRCFGSFCWPEPEEKNLGQRNNLGTKKVGIRNHVNPRRQKVTMYID